MKKWKILLPSLLAITSMPLTSLSGCVENHEDYRMVQFDTMGGSFISSIRVAPGSIVNRPNDPTKEGFDFDNWYDDNQFAVSHDFSQPVENDMVLYAKWIDPIKPIPSEIELSKTKLSLDVGNYEILFADVLPKGSSQEVTWTITSGEDVISISDQGRGKKVMALKEGTAKIKVASLEKPDIYSECDVEVNRAQPSPTSVTISQSELSLTLGDNPVTLFATVLPTGASQEVTWKSSDESAATVDKDGNVTAKAEGVATISVYPKGYESTITPATCEVIVNPIRPHPESISLNKNELTLDEGTTEHLFATVLPTGASQEVVWESSDEDIVTVSEDGIVTAKDEGSGKGNATITATTVDNPQKQAQCSVTVNQGAIPDAIELSQNVLSLSTGGNSETLFAYVIPSKASQDVTWTSSDPEVASVDNNGVVTSHLKKGSTTITVKSVDNPEKQAWCSVIVGSDTPVPTRVSLNKTSSTLYFGQSEKLLATVYPKEAEQTVVWESSDPSVATVDNGVITAGNTPGQTKITVTVENYPGIKEECVVEITDKPSPEEYKTVKFNSNGGSEVPSQIIKNNECATRPRNPKKYGYYFVCWCTDESCQTPFNWSTPIQADMTLYAKWGDEPTVFYSVKLLNQTIDGFTINVDEVEGKKDAEICITSSKFFMHEVSLFAIVIGGRNISNYEFIISDEDHAILFIPGSEVIGDVQIGLSVPTQPEVENFETDPWSTVCYFANRGLNALARIYGHESDPEWFVGKKRTVTLNNVTHKVKVVGVEQDYLDEEHENPVALTFQFDNAVSNESGTGLTTKWGLDWSWDFWGSPINNALNSSSENVDWANDESEHKSVMLMLNESEPDLVKNIKSVCRGINCIHWLSDFELEKRNTKLFCPTMAGLFSGAGIDNSTKEDHWFDDGEESKRAGHDCECYKREGQQYQFYDEIIGDDVVYDWLGQTLYDCLKFRDCNNKVVRTWLSSMMTYGLQYYWHFAWNCDLDGRLHNNRCTNEFSVAPCFCI